MTTLIFLGLMLSGTFALGISDVFRRKYLKDGVDDQALLAITLFFTGVFLIPVLFLVGIPEIEKGFWQAFVITVTLNLISQNLFIRAFKLSEASLIAPLRLIIPPLVILTGFIFLKEVPSLTGLFGILVTMAGLWFLLFEKRSLSLTGSALKDRGVIYGLLGSVLFAISFPFDKIAVVTSSALFATAMIFTTLGIITYIINTVLITSYSNTVINTLTKHTKATILISVFTSLGVVLTNQALNYSLAAYASSLKRLQAFWTVVIAGRFLQEEKTGKRILATAIMLAGILLTVL